MISIGTVKEQLKELVTEEFEQEVLLLEETDRGSKTVTIDTFVDLFAQAELTYESLTQPKYEKYQYSKYFAQWHEQGLI